MVLVIMPVVSSLLFLYSWEERFWKSLSVYIPEMRFSNVLVSSMPALLLTELFSERSDREKDFSFYREKILMRGAE